MRAWVPPPREGQSNESRSAAPLSSLPLDRSRMLEPQKLMDELAHSVARLFLSLASTAAPPSPNTELVCPEGHLLLARASPVVITTRRSRSRRPVHPGDRVC